MSVTSFCSGSRSMTGWREAGSNSLEFASARPQHVAGELDDRALQAQADAQERHALLARVPDRVDLALDAAVPEPAGDQDAVDAGQDRRSTSPATSSSEAHPPDRRPSRRGGTRRGRAPRSRTGRRRAGSRTCRPSAIVDRARSRPRSGPTSARHSVEVRARSRAGGAGRIS